MDHIGDAPHKGGVDVANQVGGHDTHTVMFLHLLEQIGHLHIGVAVVGVLHLAALAEDGVAFVEEEHTVGPLGLGKYRLEVFLRFTDILADDLGDVDLVHLHIQLIGNDLGAHGLAGTGGPGKEDGQAPAIGNLLVKTPVVVHPMLELDVATSVLKQPFLVLRHDHVVPAEGGAHPAGQVPQLMDHLAVTALVHLPAENGGGPVQPGQSHRLAAGQLYLTGGKAEFGGQLLHRQSLFQGGLLQEGPEQGHALLFGGVRHLQLHRQPVQLGPDRLVGEEKELLLRQIQLQNGLEELFLRRLLLAVAVQPVHVGAAQAGPCKPGDEGPLPGPLLRLVAVQQCKNAPLFTADHQVFYLKTLARSRASRQADDLLPRFPEQQVQPAGQLLSNDQRPLWLFGRPVKEPQSGQRGHCPGAEEFQHGGPQGQLTRRQLLPLKQAGKGIPAGKTGEIFLHGVLQGKKELHRQRGGGQLLGNVILEVGKELFILFIHRTGVSQYQTVGLKRIQAAPPDELHQRELFLRPVQTGLDGGAGGLQLSRFLPVQLGVQSQLGRLYQVMLKFLPADHQPQHVAHIILWPQPLMMLIKEIDTQIQPGKQIVHQLPLTFVALTDGLIGHVPQVIFLHALPPLGCIDGHGRGHHGLDDAPIAAHQLAGVVQQRPPAHRYRGTAGGPGHRGGYAGGRGERPHGRRCGRRHGRVGDVAAHAEGGHVADGGPVHDGGRRQAAHGDCHLAGDHQRGGRGAKGASTRGCLYHWICHRDSPLRAGWSAGCPLPPASGWPEGWRPQHTPARYPPPEKRR